MTRKNMPGGGAVQTDMLSGIEEESDIYEGFAPHVDYATVPISNESSPGNIIISFIFISPTSHTIHHKKKSRAKFFSS